MKLDSSLQIRFFKDSSQVAVAGELEFGNEDFRGAPGDAVEGIQPRQFLTVKTTWKYCVSRSSAWRCSIHGRSCSMAAPGRRASSSAPQPRQSQRAIRYGGGQNVCQARRIYESAAAPTDTLLSNRKMGPR